MDGVKYPRYDGTTCVRRWTRQFERVLDAHAVIADDRKLVLASVHLDGAALDWYDVEFANLLPAHQTWARFQIEIYSFFTADAEDEAIQEELRAMTRKEGESVDEYAHRFLILHARMRAPSNLDSLVRPWVRGLGEPLSSDVFQYMQIHYVHPAAGAVNPRFIAARRAARDYEKARMASQGPVQPKPDVVPARNGQVPDDVVRQLAEAFANLSAANVARKSHGTATAPGRRAELADLDEDPDDSEAPTTFMARGQDPKRKRQRKPRKKTTLDEEWLNFVKSNWSIPLHLIQSRSKRQLYMQLILAIREVMGFTPKPRKQKQPKTEADVPQVAQPVQQEQVGQDVDLMDINEPPRAVAAHRADPARLVECKIAGKPVKKVIIDPGSTNSILDIRCANALHLKKLRTTGPIELANGEKVTPKGRTDDVGVSVGGVLRQLSFNVVDAKGSYDVILGLDWLRACAVVARYKYNWYEIGRDGPTVRQRGKELLFVERRKPWEQRRRPPPPRNDDREEEEEEKDASLDVVLAEMLKELEDQDSEEESSACFMATSVVPDADLSPDLPIKVAADTKQVLAEYSDCFASSLTEVIATPLLKCHLELRDGARPRRCGRGRRLAPTEKAFVEDQLKELEVAGMIEKWEDASARLPCPNGVEWLSPISIATKKSGEFRLCVAYCALNENTVEDTYGLPRVDDALDSVSGRPCYTLLDHYAGFHAIPMADDSILSTAFHTPFGVFVWRRMPFGLRNAPAVYSRMVDMAYCSLSNVAVYIDDLCIAHEHVEAVPEDLRKVLTCCRKAKLKLKSAKCHFGYSAVQFLGHTLSSEGLGMMQERVNKVANMPKPTNVEELRSWLGMIGYYRRFIPAFATTAAPLTFLLSPKNEWNWDLSCDRAFEGLSKKMIEGAVLATPSDNLPYIIDTDASNIGAGGVLSQVIRGEERPIAFYSRKLTPSEKNYSVTEKEGVALIASLKAFRPYVLGRHVTIRVDHAALPVLFRKQDLSGRLARWQALLHEYNATLMTRSGERHRNADGLSRLPCKPEFMLLPGAEDDESQDKFAFLGQATRQAFRNDPWYEDAVTDADGEAKKFRWCDHRLGILDEDGRVKICLLSSEATSVTIEAHREIGHYDGRTTAKAIRRQFWFPSMYSYVQDVVSKCTACQLNSDYRSRKTVTPVEIWQPFDCVQLDTVSGFPRTQAGKVAFICAVDCFTGFAITKSLTNLTAETAAQFLLDKVLMMWGVPRAILTDNGPEFGGVFADTAFNARILHHRSSPGYPASHGKVERVQKLILDRLRRMDNPRRWDSNLPAATHQVNSRVTETQSLSPLQLLTGVSVHTVFDMETKSRPTLEQAMQASLEEFADEEKHNRLLDLACARDEFADKVAQSRQRWATDPPSKRSFQTGDVVRVLKLTRGNKLLPLWELGTIVWMGDKDGCAVEVDGKVRRIHQSRVMPFRQ